MSDTPRLDQLQAMVAGAEARMVSPTCSDQNYAVLGRFRVDLLAQIADLGGTGTAKKETALDEFTKRLHDRTAPKAPRRTKSG